MAEISKNTKVSDEIIDYDKISKRVLVSRLLDIDDITITPKAFNRIMVEIQNMPPYERC